jgi:aryl-alcohol dehydrogenase-like predicted oxidoreductase
MNALKRRMAMKYRLLGNSGLRVAEAALGTMTFGDDGGWGAAKEEAQQDNLASFNLALSAEQLKSLDEASRVELGFPYDLYDKEMIRAFAYGGMRDRLLV